MIVIYSSAKELPSIEWFQLRRPRFQLISPNPNQNPQLPKTPTYPSRTILPGTSGPVRHQCWSQDHAIKRKKRPPAYDSEATAVQHGGLSAVRRLHRLMYGKLSNGRDIWRFRHCGYSRSAVSRHRENKTLALRCSCSNSTSDSIIWYPRVCVRKSQQEELRPLGNNRPNAEYISANSRNVLTQS